MRAGRKEPGEVRERPIMFSGPMVCAILAGTKTQTRRIVKSNLGRVPPTLVHREPAGSRGERWVELGGWVRCPYGEPGDRFVFLCSWATEKQYDKVKPSRLPPEARIWTLFDGERPGWTGKLRPGHFMPKRLRGNLALPGTTADRGMNVAVSAARSASND